MKLPNLRDVTIDGTPFADAGGAAQSRYIAEIQDAHYRKEAETDPGALTAAEIERLAAAEARLAEAQAAHDAAAQRWTALKVARWQGQHERSLINGVVKRVTRSIPSEGEIGDADQAKVAAEHELQRTLIWRTREMQAVDAARWVRARQAEGVIR